MAGIRDKLIREYFGVSSKVVWNTVMEDIPRPKPLIANAVEKEWRMRFPDLLRMIRHVALLLGDFVEFKSFS